MPPLIQADVALASAILFEFAGEKAGAGEKVEFQFPPKIVSDSRKASWKEREVAGQVEPIVVYASSGPRELAMQITYIYDGIWNCAKISKQVRLLRGYFQRVRESSQQRNLVIKMKLWCIGGNEPESMSFRMKSCDVKYSETMIYEDNPNKAYPLRTDITCDLAAWTRGDNDVSLERLEGRLTPSWY